LKVGIDFSAGSNFSSLEQTWLDICQAHHSSKKFWNSKIRTAIQQNQIEQA
jgi:hypothetical protein